MQDPDGAGKASQCCKGPGRGKGQGSSETQAEVLQAVVLRSVGLGVSLTQYLLNCFFFHEPEVIVHRAKMSG